MPLGLWSSSSTNAAPPSSHCSLCCPHPESILAATTLRACRAADRQPRSCIIPSLPVHTGTLDAPLVLCGDVCLSPCYCLPSSTFPMSKRGADHQLTKDDAEAEDEMEEQQQAGPWRPASESQLKQRVIVRAKRTTGDDGATAAGGATTVTRTHSRHTPPLCAPHAADTHRCAAHCVCAACLPYI